MSVLIDGASLLARLEADMTLGEAEQALAREGLTLRAAGAPRGMTIGKWIAAGAPGTDDPWLDPVDHLIAGLEATLRRGDKLVLKPAPRRAVGPDYVALFFGMQERFGAIDRVWLRVHRIDGGRPTPHLFETAAPPLGDGERALLDAIFRELGGT